MLRIQVLLVSERWFIRYASSFLSFCTRWSLALFSCHSINPIETADGESVSATSGNCPTAPLYAHPCLSHGNLLPGWQAVFRRI